MSKVLVTGASGYIGGHLVRYLNSHQKEVRCLVRPTSDTERLDPADVEIVHGDLLNPDSLRRAVVNCDVVYHLAGVTSAGRGRDFFRANCAGSYNLAWACAQAQTPPILVIVSSLAAAGTSRKAQHQTEDDPPRPISDYGRSKRGGEIAASHWADRVPISIVRPGVVFGPGNRDLLPVFQSVARFRMHVVPGFVRYRIGLIHHDDLLEIIERVVLQGTRIQASSASHHSSNFRLQSGHYFAVDPECPTYTEFGRMIQRSLGVQSPLIMHVVEPFLWLLAAGNQLRTEINGQSSQSNVDKLNVDKIRELFAGHWTCSADRVQDELGFQPAASLQQRLDETSTWYREHGWL